MNVFELAKKYYPLLWDDSRIDALVAAGKLTQTEATEIKATDNISQKVGE